MLQLSQSERGSELDLLERGKVALIILFSGFEVLISCGKREKLKYVLLNAAIIIAFFRVMLHVTAHLQPVLTNCSFKLLHNSGVRQYYRDKNSDRDQFKIWMNLILL